MQGCGALRPILPLPRTLPSPPPSHQAASIKAARSKVALIEAEFDAKGFAMAAECTEAILAEAREEALEFEKEESQLR